MDNINSYKQHDRVRLKETGELGRVARVDPDEYLVYVDVTVASAFGGKGVDTIAVDPGDVEHA